MPDLREHTAPVGDGRGTGKRYYLAYGSNLSLEQMACRCPDARVAGKALIPDWKLAFRTHATIEPERGRKVPVLVWMISGTDEENLDRYEGYPRYYIKRNMKVTMTDLSGNHPREINGMAYLMTEGRPLRKPWDVYLETIMEGYRRFGFDPIHLKLALKECESGGGTV